MEGKFQYYRTIPEKHFYNLNDEEMEEFDDLKKYFEMIDSKSKKKGKQ